MSKRLCWWSGLSVLALPVVLWAVWAGFWRSSPTPLLPVPGHQHGPHGGDEHVESGALPKGPHGGSLFSDGDLTIELAQQVQNGRTQFVAYPFSARLPQPPASIRLNLNVMADANAYNVDFQVQKVRLLAELPQTVPHVRELVMTAEHGNHRHQWQYE